MIERGEELELFANYRAGDFRAGDKIITSNMDFAEREAGRHARRHHESLEDLQQEAAEALLHARETFDPARGVRFITYASHAIASRLQRYCQRERSGWDASFAAPETESIDPALALDADTVGQVARAAALTKHERVILDLRLLADEPMPVRKLASRLRVSAASVFRLEGEIFARIKARF